MKKILVTTDFSTSSKAGMRFAIQLATQMDVELVFFHCFQALIPTTVLHERIENSLKKQGDAFLDKLVRFVAQVHKSMGVEAGVHRCVVVESLDPDKAILDYAKDHECQFICMSTHGAGAIRKVLGTHTGKVLQKSSIPVLVVPHTYRARSIHKILYAADLENFDKEMPVVSSFADTLNVKVDMAHFYYPGEINLDHDSLTKMWKLQYPQLERVFLERYDLDKRFNQQLDQVSAKSKPSIIVFFTHINKTLFDKLFSVSISKKVSFVTKIPMLVFQK